MMNAAEKFAWVQLVVSMAAILLVSVLFPWLGYRSAGGYGRLGLIALGVLFLRPRKNQVVIDERDRAIAYRARSIAVRYAWYAFMFGLVVILSWCDHHALKTVSVEMLMWLLWTQAALMFAVNGLVAIVLHRRMERSV